MFVAIKGDRFDANTFAEEALAKGAAFVVIDNPHYVIDDRTILVHDSLDVLQQLALFHRRFLQIPIIGLTGSNGKTTTKELINVVLSKKYITKATIGNLNNHIGVPLTLLSFDKKTEVGIVEMGANHQREIDFLCKISEPDYGYITNFGKAHLEGFGGFEGVIKGKSELYEYLLKHQKTAFVNLDDPLQVIKTETLKRFGFSTIQQTADVVISDVGANPFVQIKVDGSIIASNLVGSYNVTNICAAVAIGRSFGVAVTDIKLAIENYIPDNNRSQLIDRNGHKIILDAYNANPTSMAAAIKHFASLPDLNKIAILGDMFELGDESSAEHAEIVKTLAELPNIESHLIGKDFFAHQTALPHLHFYSDYDTFSQSFALAASATILIKGSRGMALERALELI